MANKEIAELVEFLKEDARADLKQLSLEYLVGLSDSEKGIEVLKKTEILEALTKLITHPSDSFKTTNLSHVKEVYKLLINVCVEEDVSWRFLHIDNSSPLIHLFNYIADIQSYYADYSCRLLSNITRHERCSRFVVQHIMESGVDMEKLVFAFQQEHFNAHNNDLHYIAALLSNLTQTEKMRTLLLDENLFILPRLLPFLSYKNSKIRRGGIAATTKNCSFDSRNHKWLMSDAVDIIPRLLLPLAGPEEFDDDEMASLPDDLQYLPDDKEREEDVDIRMILLETLLQLCPTRRGREALRMKGAYYILREYHKWERQEAAKIMCQNVVEILIRDEEDIGCDDLATLQTP